MHGIYLRYVGIDEEKECRVTFNEITKETVKKSMEKPRKINLNTVDAQQARRVLDRIVGYKISPILWKKIKSGLSAGRVQTVALRLIVEKEREIMDFKLLEYILILSEKETFFNFKSLEIYDNFIIDIKRITIIVLFIAFFYTLC